MPVSGDHYDAVIIGGGPGGSTAATCLARAGKRVLLLEKERFPRFHIGESLLPYNRRLFDEIGITSALQQAGFPRKFGAQFYTANGSAHLQFVFRQGRFTQEIEAFQVERSTFDHLLLKHARASGADVREQWTVTKFARNRDSITIEARDHTNERHTFHGSFLIDASGRSNLTGNQEGLRVIHPYLKKLAIFGHFKGVQLDQGEKGGDTIIVRFENKWFWIIPITAEKTSVGCVLDQTEFTSSGEPLEQLFSRLWNSSPPLRARMATAELIGQYHTTADFSYTNRSFVGPRLLRVGDAAGFMDPIFSAGVYLAMYSAKLSADTVLECLNGADHNRRLRAYEKRVHSAMQFYWELVENFYTMPFLDVFFHPRENFSLVSAVNAALAGDIEGGWKLRWRLRLFFLLVKLQARFPFAPRICFD